ncbi:unnamed protein product [Bemisia tabaci]|uniref:AAA+ ATPase domain-containing protein n=1 Tax=Bemisia tabaci TaxID=7038 RepID=A0A9P0F3C1_BEMTA|nr:unnamed protein product [Bemisia tabaci]
MTKVTLNLNLRLASLSLFFILSAKTAAVSAMIGAQFYDTGPHFSDLVKLRDKALFVDKSLLIEYILSGPEHIVIEAPEGFGKTTNLRMIKEFLELEVDIDGKAVDSVNTTKNFETFATPPLEIVTKYPQIFKDHFAQSPVIYVNMGTVSITQFDESFRRMVAELYMRHDYLERSSRLSRPLRDDLMRLYRGKSPDLSLNEVAAGGEKLAYLLREHHQRDVIVLIDDYDAPLREALQAQSSALDMKNFDHVYENVMLFITRLIQGNSNVVRSVLTGRIRVVASTKIDPDKLVHLPIFDHEQLWRYYGLTKEDIHTLGDQLLRETKWELNYTDVNAWYGGYKTIHPEQKLYNTLSTTTYLKTHQLKRHRIQAEGLRGLSGLLSYERLGKTLEEAFEEQTRISPVKMVQRDLRELRKMITDPNHKLNRDLALQYLVEIGLFSLDGDRLTVPNLEADADLKALLLTMDYFKSKFRIQDVQVNNYIEALDRLDNRGQTYQDLATAVLGLFDFRLPATSRELLHSLVYLAADTKFPQVRTEVAIDRKRRDFFVQRYDSTGILVGVECGNGTAYDALKQLVDHKRYEIFRQEKLRTGILVGLAINERLECSLAYLHDNGTYSYSLAGHKNYTVKGARERILKNDGTTSGSVTTFCNGEPLVLAHFGNNMCASFTMQKGVFMDESEIVVPYSAVLRKNAV